MRRALVVWCLASVLVLSGVATAQEKGDLHGRDLLAPTAAPVVRTIAGSPLTVLVGDDASFQVLNTAVTGQGQIYPGSCTTSTADMGVFIRQAGALYAPNFAEHPCSSAAAGLGTPHTPISISAVTGSGTEGDPYQVVVVVSAGTTGIQMTMTVRYVNGQNYFTKLLSFTSAVTTSFDVFLGADIYLAGFDTGVPYLEPTSLSPGGQDCGVPPAYTILLIPLTAAQRYTAVYWDTVWNEIASGLLSNTVSAGCQDNGAALQWQNVTVPGGGSASIQAATSFGTIPVITQFRVDSVAPAQGNPGQSLNVTVTGIGFESGTTFDFGAGITVGAPTIGSATSATVPLTIAPGATLGFRNVTGEQSPGGLTHTLTNGFEVIAGFTTITCADWVSEVGTWGPATAPCGDLTSTTNVPLYESASFFDVFTDFTYEAELVATRPIQPTAANVIFLRGDPTPRGLNSVWDTGYAFGFTTAATGRKFSIFRYSNGRPIVVQAWVAPVPPAVINPSGVANTLKVEANGGTLTFFLNGTPVKTISGQTLLSGQVGVGMVRSQATGAAGPKDTLVINAATVTPGGGTRPSKGVSVAQERANEAANRAALTTKPDPLFSDGGKKW